MSQLTNPFDILPANLFNILGTQGQGDWQRHYLAVLLRIYELAEFNRFGLTREQVLADIVEYLTQQADYTEFIILPDYAFTLLEAFRTIQQQRNRANTPASFTPPTTAFLAADWPAPHRLREMLLGERSHLTGWRRKAVEDGLA